MGWDSKSLKGIVWSLEGRTYHKTSALVKGRDSNLKLDKN